MVEVTVVNTVKLKEINKPVAKIDMHDTVTLSEFLTNSRNAIFAARKRRKCAVS